MTLCYFWTTPEDPTYVRCPHKAAPCRGPYHTEHAGRGRLKIAAVWRRGYTLIFNLYGCFGCGALWCLKADHPTRTLTRTRTLWGDLRLVLWLVKALLG